eukprot:TRINITY_DN40934_c0_g1_i1.p1 TRINITY_DN40934_c0_g1~~TRINITY_DN40934_c0_g1_i1.p1  ORF type:complete len:254 (+),score=33.90 TRINITY_DN40934_c0_g1_i1:100-861(+)
MWGQPNLSPRDVNERFAWGPPADMLPWTSLVDRRVASVQFVVVSVAGDTLLNLELSPDTSISRLKDIVMERLPEKGPLAALVMGNIALEEAQTLERAGIAPSCMLQAIFGLGPTTFRFERIEVIEEPEEVQSLVALVKVCPDESLVEAYEIVSAASGATLVSSILRESGLAAIELLNQDLRQEFAIERGESPWSYSLALDQKPREAKLLYDLLRNAQEVEYFNYEHDDSDSYGSGAELLVDGVTRISLWNIVR